MTVERFIQYLRFERRYSPHTIIAYQSDLDQFSEYILKTYETSNISGATPEMIRSWIVYLVESGLEARSINRKVTTLRSYYRFLTRENLVDSNPVATITPLKTAQKLPVFLESEKMSFMLDDVEFAEGYEGKRNKLILELLYSTGIRLSELINLKDKDIDLGKCTIKVTGKRNKQRIIPFNNKLRDHIDDYMKERNLFFGQSDQFPGLFVTIKGASLYPKLVYRIVSSYINKVSTITKKSPHVLRHTFATHMLNNGADLNAIKEILGHASLAATQVYTHNTVEKLKKIYNQAHPKA